MKRIFAAGAMLMGLMGFAGPQITPQGIIVNPIPTELEVQTWVDRDPSGVGNSVYYFGDKIRISVRVNQDAYVYLFNINSNGQIDLILPNSLGQDNYLGAGEVRQFPQPGTRYEFTVTGPAGVDQVLAVASRQPLSLNQIADIRGGQVYISGASNLARALSIVVTPLPQQDWVSDSVRYNVQPSAAANPRTQPSVVVVNPNPASTPNQRSMLARVAPVQGKTVVWQATQGNSTTIAYQSTSKYDVEHIFAYYHKNLLSMGWVKTRFQSQGAAYRADYRRGSEWAVVTVIPRDGRVEYKMEWGR